MSLRPTTVKPAILLAFIVLFSVQFFGISAEALIPYQFRIDTVSEAGPGSIVTIPVVKDAGSLMMGGFDMFIGFDSAAMELIDVIPGPIFTDPDGWEYFSYQSDNADICPGCPTGVIRAIGFYDMADGHDPINQEVPDGTNLFDLQFAISSDTIGCEAFEPVRFFWNHCVNNMISDSGGQSMVISSHVYDYGYVEITDTTAGFPTYFGAPDECLNPGDQYNPFRFADFINGGVNIDCTDVPPVPYRIRIDTLSGAPFGSAISIPVVKEAGSIDMDGFDFLISFDTLGFEFVDVTPGAMFVDPDGWEDFEYRQGIGEDSLTGFVRAVGVYDVNDGHDPVNQEIPDGTILFTLNFYVTMDSVFECNAFPLRFYWHDCGDNAIAYTDNGVTLALSHHVYDSDFLDITDTLAGFPTYGGAPTDCFINPGDPVRFIDFVSGSVELDCPVVETDPFAIQIDLMHNISLGADVSIPVTKIAGSTLMDGFDLLIGYDANILQLTDVDPGLIFDDPDGWEYFEYRTDSFPGCDSTCPSGLVRVVGVYDVNDGQTPTNQGVADGEALLDLQFTVSDDYVYDCLFTPISFFWIDCGDNAIASGGDGSLALSGRVYDFIGSDITDSSASFPTYFGSPNQCFVSPGNPVRNIDFYNGGVNIICSEPIDDRGDLNLNGMAYEIADFVVYSNYFLYGLSAFTVDVERQVAASDINNDGLNLTFQDYIYMLRVTEGNAMPYSSPDKMDNNNFSGNLYMSRTDYSILVSSDFADSVGGLFISFYAPDLQDYEDYSINVAADAEHMDFAYDTYSGNLNILIYKFLVGQGTDTLSATIPAGPVDILELVYSGGQPSYAYSLAGGYMGEFVDLTVEVANYICGDADDDQAVNLLDITFMVKYLYKQGDPPVNPEAADADGDGNINLLDITYLINYLYKSGPPPICE